jgi:hypothetical protein
MFSIYAIAYFLNSNFNQFILITTPNSPTEVENQMPIRIAVT